MTLPLNEDLKLRSNAFVVQFGQPFLLPDGKVWKFHGYEFRGSDTTTDISPLKFEEIPEHEEYNACFNFVFNATAPDNAANPTATKPQYNFQSLVTPRVNFNNVVAYYGSHSYQSCTDGLCAAPQAGDTLQVAYEATDRLKYTVKSFWIQTEFHPNAKGKSKSKSKSNRLASPAPSDSPDDTLATGSKRKTAGTKQAKAAKKILSTPQGRP
jgi:hypothetical protein